MVENKFLSEENKANMEVNLIKFLKNNFRKEHLNYFYEITKNILIKFNCLNQKAIKPKNYNKTDKSNFLSLNKDFKYLTKITDVLIKVVEEEKNKIMMNHAIIVIKVLYLILKTQKELGFKSKILNIIRVRKIIHFVYYLHFY